MFRINLTITASDTDIDQDAFEQYVADRLAKLYPGADINVSTSTAAKCYAYPVKGETWDRDASDEILSLANNEFWEEFCAATPAGDADDTGAAPGSLAAALADTHLSDCDGEGDCYGCGDAGCE